MGKKKKSNKLCKMSDEERARFLQLKADMEEEFKRRKMKFIATFLKNKLIREEAFCRLNLSKINQEWRNILRQVKCNELREDIANVQEQCQHMLEHRQKIIKNLLDDLEMAHTMHEALFNAQMEIIEEFNNIQQHRIGFLHQTYEYENRTFAGSFVEEIRNFKTLSNQMQQQIESVYYQLEEQTEETYQRNYEHFLSKLDDIQASMNLKMETICHKGEEKLEHLSQVQRQLLYDYTSYMQTFNEEYKNLKDKDDEYTLQTKTYCESLAKSHIQITNLKIQAFEAEESYQIETKQLRGLKDYLSHVLNQQKISMRLCINEQEMKFKVMTKVSYLTIQNLKTFQQKGETILQVAIACSRYETEQQKLRTSQGPTKDKNLPAPENYTAHSVKSNLSTETETEKQKKFYDWHLMEDFWKRVNYAESDIICLSQFKRSLESENHQLKNQLQQQLLDLNISNRSTNISNRLLNEYVSKRPCSMRLEQTACKPDKTGRKSYSANALKTPKTRVLNVTEAKFTNAVRSHQLRHTRSKLPEIFSIKHDV